jgi:hypothetical protein
MSASPARSDTGPVLPPRSAIQAQARELKALAMRAEEFAGGGPTANLAAALLQFERMRAILGPAPEAAASVRPRCGCPQVVVDRVERGGTCGRGGCPYGGDF